MVLVPLTALSVALSVFNLKRSTTGAFVVPCGTIRVLSGKNMSGDNVLF